MVAGEEGEKAGNRKGQRKPGCYSLFSWVKVITGPEGASEVEERARGGGGRDRERHRGIGDDTLQSCVKLGFFWPELLISDLFSLIPAKQA